MTNKKITTYFTIGVIFVSIVFAIYIAGLDFVFSETVNKFIINPTERVSDITNAVDTPNIEITDADGNKIEGVEINSVDINNIDKK